MHEHTTIPLPHPQLITEDPFTEVVRQGAQRLLAQAIEAEGDCSEALEALLGPEAPGLSPATISRLK